MGSTSLSRIKTFDRHHAVRRDLVGGMHPSYIPEYPGSKFLIKLAHADPGGHRRSYEREVLIFEPRHYLALLERKPGALDHAAPLAGWPLPDEFLRLRRLLEARLGKPGTREDVQVLRRLEDFQLDHVRGAIRDAVRLGAIGFDAVTHLVRCRLDPRPPHLDLAQYPHLPVPRVTTTAAADYLTLLGAGAE